VFERELRELSFVPRWSIARVHQRQTVAEHSFYVALYADQIADFLGINDPTTRLSLIRLALWHDVEESFTGDIPGPMKAAILDGERYRQAIDKGLKRRFPGAPDPRFYDFTPYTEILKVANLVEESMYLATEMQMGNQAVAHLYEIHIKRTRDAIDALSMWDQRTRDALWKVYLDKLSSARVGASIEIYTENNS
jgi:5'-deoxynucleotidase YfbR-like HD superfamily hydrolase